MSRELKFRAWHNGGLSDITFSEPNAVDFWYKVKNYPDLYDVMQYTGLKDKNGKEIYEGDILNFKGELFNIVWIRNACMLSAEPTDKLGRQHFLSPSYFDYAEIIGNIYENPKLLNSDTNIQESDTTEAKSGKQKFWPK